jgi:hypothetical protein
MMRSVARIISTGARGVKSALRARGGAGLFRLVANSISNARRAFDACRRRRRRRDLQTPRLTAQWR